LQNSTVNLDAADTGSLSFGTLTSATFGGLKGSRDLAVQNTTPAAVALTVGGNNQSTEYAGNLTGPGSLSKAGTGTWTLFGANTYAGTAAINGGVLSVSSDGNLGTPPASNLPGSLTINGGTLQATAGFTLDSRRGIALGPASGSGTGTIEVAANETLLYDGIMASQGTGTGNLTKTGAGRLALGGASTYGGATTISAGTVQLTGGDDRLPTGTTVRLSSSGATLDLNGFDQTLGGLQSVFSGTGTTYVTGTTSTLTVGPTTVNFLVGANAGAAASKVTLDMTGLETFSYHNTSGSGKFDVGPQAGSNLGGILNLADTNIITASRVTLLDTYAGASQAIATRSEVHLGRVNTINTDTLGLAQTARSNSLFDFRGGLDSPSLTLRAFDGTGRVTTVRLAQGGAGNGGQMTSTVDLTAGTTDALIQDLVITRQSPGTNLNNTNTGTFRMGAGTLDATTITVARLDAGTTGTGSTANGTLVLQNGGTIRVGTLTVGEFLPTASNTINATVTLTSGTLQATTVQAGASNGGTVNRTFTWTAGTIRNYDASTDLTVTNLGSTANGTGTRSFMVDAGRTVTVNATVSQAAGAAAIDKDGDGLLILGDRPSGSNDNAGLGLAVNAGTVNLNKTSSGTVRAIGTGGLTINDGLVTITGSGGDQIANAADVTVHGGRLDLNGVAETIDGLQGTGGSVVNDGGGDIVLTVGAGNDSGATYAGVIADRTTGTGTIALTKTGTGTQTLSGDNTYTGDTLVTGGGKLQANHDNAFGTAGTVTVSSTAGNQLLLGNGTNVSRPLVIQGGSIAGQGALHVPTGSATYSGPINITAHTSAGGHFSGGTLTLAGPVTSSVNVVFRAGTVIISDPGNSFASSSVGGTLRLAADNVLPTDATISVGDGTNGVLDLNGFNQVLNAVTKGSNAATINNTAAGTSSTLTVGNNDANSTFAGVVSNTGSGAVLDVVKTGTGTLTLSGASTYTGGTTVNGGTLQFSANNNLGATSGGIALGGGTLRYTGTGSLTVSRPVTLTADSSIQSNSAALFLTGRITDSEDSYGLTFLGGPVYLNNAASDFDGPVLVKSTATVYPQSNNALGTTAGTTTVESGGQLSVETNYTTPETLYLNGGILRTSSEGSTMQWWGDVVLGAASVIRAKYQANVATLAVNGVISGNHNVNVGQGESGDVIFGGSNTYSGATTVHSGRLLVNGDTSGATGTVTVLAGATLGGSGTIGGPVTVNAGGFVTPGTSPGILTFADGLSLDSDATLTIEINAFAGVPLAGTHYDQANVPGIVNLNADSDTGAILNLVVPSAVLRGSSYTIINNDGLDAVQGTFAGLAEGATITIGSNTFKLSYVGGDGNDVVLLENGSPPDLVFVDDSGSNFNLGHAPALNQIIPDADLGAAGFQTAIFGYNAFSTITDAIAAVSETGRIVVNAGTYTEAVDLNKTVTLQLTESPGITTSSLASIVGSTVDTFGLTLSTDGGASPIAGVIAGTGGLTKIGDGTLTLSGANTYSGDTTISAGTLKLGAANVIPDGAGKGNVVFNPATGTATLDLGGFGETINGLSSSGAGSSFVDNSVAGGPYTLTVGGGNASGSFGGVIRNTTGTVALTKTGTGVQTLSGANAYSGATIVSQGTLALSGGVNRLPTTTGLTVGTGSTAGTLDLTDASQAVASFISTTNSTTATNSITIGTGQTLTVNGNVTIGPATNQATTLVNISGPGSLVVNAPGGTFALGGYASVATNNHSKATLDMSGLATFTADLTTGSFLLGRTGDNSNRNWPSFLYLAADSTLKAATLTVGQSANASVTSLVLGAGSNTLWVDTLNIGTGSRDSGAVTFAGSTGTLQVRNRAGTGRATLNLGTGGANTGVTAANTFDVTGHDADLLLGAVVIGTQPRSTTWTNVFSFDQGTLDMTSLVMATTTQTSESGNGATSPRVTYATLNLGGGTVSIANGITALGQVTGTGYTVAARPHTKYGTINVSGGTVNIGATGGNSVVTSSVNVTGTANVAALAAHGTLNVTGGVVTLAGNFVKGAQGGSSTGGITTNATVTVAGGMLNMGSQSIGGTQAIDNLNFEFGTLQNVAQINNGAVGLTKTTAGTLVLAGTNTYSGDTLVAAGTLQLGSNDAIPDGTGKGNVTVDSVLDLNGFSDTINGLSGSGIVDNSAAGAASLTAGNNGATSTFDGTIQDTAGAVSFTKTGAGVLTLTGDHTYAGTTTVSGGTLALVSSTANNTISQSPTINVQTGSFLDVTGLDTGTATDTLILTAGQTLKGTGTVTGNVTALAGSHTSPGSSPGIQYYVGDLNYNTGANLDIEIVGGFSGAPVAGTDYDQIDLQGQLNLDADNGGGVTLNLTTSGGPIVPGSVFTIINNDGTDPVLGTIFNGVPNGGTITAGGTTFYVFYSGGDGNDVVLSESSGIYVEDTAWNALTVGDIIADADFGTPGNQPAIYGVTAFNSIAAALTAAGSDGRVIVNDGNYPVAVSLSGTQTLTVTLGATVILNSLASVAGTAVQIDGTKLVTGDGTTTGIAGFITGAGGLTKQGSGILTITGAATHTGVTAVDGGTLQLNTGGSLSGSSALDLGTGTFQVVNGATATVGSVTNAVGAGSLLVDEGIMTVTSGLDVDTLRIGNMDANGGTATLTVSGGAVMIGNGTETLDIGVRQSNVTTNAGTPTLVGTLDLTAANSVTINVAGIRLGNIFGAPSNEGTVRGSLLLASTGINVVTATTILAGDSSDRGNAVMSTIQLGGAANTIRTNTLTLGGRKSQGQITNPANGSLLLEGKTLGTRVNVNLANSVNTGATVIGNLNLNSGTLTALIDVLRLGQLGGSSGSATGTLTFANGSVSANSVIMGDGARGHGVVQQSGGTFTVLGNLTDGAGSSTINLHGGAMTVDGSLQADTLTIGQGTSTGTLEFTGVGTSRVGNFNVRSNTATASTMTIPVGHTLNGTGNVAIGVPSTTGATTNFDVTGGGVWAISNTSATIDFGVANSNQNATENGATVDLSELGSFTANVANFRVGFGSRIRTTALLSDTANSITANLVTVGSSGTNNASPAVMVLGAGTNVVHANTIDVGRGKGEGTIRFASQAAGSPGTLTVRGSAGGTSAANINVGVAIEVDTGANISGMLDLRGHDVDVMADVLTIARRTRSGGGVTGTVSLDTGTFTVNTINMAETSNGTTATATINVSGGTFAVNTGGGFQLANHTGGNAANGILNITGGTVTSNADITDGGGTSTTAITLNGGLLDMAGHMIGGVIAIDNLNFRSGTLQNVGEINAGGTGVTKTTGGTLILAGTNDYTGPTSVDGGTLLVDGMLNSVSAVTVNGSAVLGGVGTIAGQVTVNSGGTITGGTLGAIGAPGAGNVGTLTVGSLFFDGGTFQADLVGDAADQIRTGGSIDLQDPAQGLFTLNAGGTTTAGAVFRLIDNTAAGAIADAFSGVAEGGSVSVNGQNAYSSYIGGTGNDFTLTTSGPAVHTETVGGADFELRLRSSSPVDTLELLRNGMVIDSRRIDFVTSYTINGIDNETDTLTVNYAASGGFFAIPVTFHGGSGGNDSLTITGGTFTEVTLNHTDAHSGSVDVDGTVVTYTGLEPVLVGVGGTHLTVNLTAGDDTTQFSMLDADADTNVDDLEILSLTGTHERTTVLDIGDYSRLTIHGGGGDDRLLLAAFTPGVFTGELAIDGGGQTDFVLLGTALNVASLDVTAAATVLNANVTTIGGGEVVINSAAWIGDSINIDTSAGGGGNVSFAGTVSGLSVSPDLTINAGTGGMVTFAGEIGAFSIPSPAPAAYFEVGGRIVAEAEDYTRRTATSYPDNWLIVPDEDPGAGVLTGARGDGRYIQSLPDQAGTGGSPTGAPSIEYDFFVTTAGTYRLYLRWANNQDVGGGGNSDSIFVDIVQKKDGITPALGTAPNLVADWYQLGNNSSTFAWDSGGQAEVNVGGAADNPITWSLTPGLYTFRISQREDGAAVDAWTLQQNSRPAPSGVGPGTSYTGVELNDLRIVNAKSATFDDALAARSFTQQAVVDSTAFAAAVTVTDFNVWGGAVQVNHDLTAIGGVIGLNGRSATVTAAGGDVILGSGSGTFRIGERNSNLSSATNGTFDVSAANSFRTNLGNLYLGWLTNDNGTGTVTGTLKLGSDNTLDGGLLRLGHIDGGNVRTVTGNIQLGVSNAFQVDTFIVGSHKGTGNVSFGSTGTLELSGRSGAATNLRIGDNSDSGTSAAATGTMNLAGGALIAVLNQLVIGDYASDLFGTGSGSATGTLTLGNHVTNDVRVNSVLLGTYNHTATTGSGTKQASGTINMSGGQFVVDGNLVRGINNGAGNGAVTNSTVNINGGAMTVQGDFAVNNVRVGHNSGSGALTVASGAVQIGTGIGSYFNVALRDNSGTSGLTTGNVDFASADSVDIHVGNLNVGTSNGAATEGHLALSNTANTIAAGTITVSDNPNSGQPNFQSTLTLGTGSNVVTADALYIGRKKGNALVKFANPGGTLDLGSATQRTDLLIGVNDVATAGFNRGELDLTGSAGGSLYLNDLTVGWGSTGSGSGGGQGWFIGGGGTIDIGPQGTDVATIQVGYNDGGANSATGGVTGIIDWAATGELIAVIDRFLIGTGLNSSTGKGTVALAQSNTIYADFVRIGDSTNTAHTTPDLTSSLTLGEANDLFVDTFRLGDRRASATVDVRGSGSTISLAGRNVAGANLVVGRNAAGTGSFVTGTLNLSNAATFDATLDQFHIGVKGDTEAGRARGLVALAADNTITANTITIGQSGDTGATAAGEQSQLHLGGGTSTISAATLLIGDRKTTGLIDFATPGGTLNLGTAASPVSMILGQKSVATAANPAGIVDLRDGRANIFASTITLGRMTNNGDAGIPSGVFHFEDGSLQFAALATDSGQADFNWYGGTIQNLPEQNLIDMNVSIKLLNAVAHRFHVDAGRTATLQANAAFTDVGGLTKTGDGQLILHGVNTHSGETLVSGGTLALSHASNNNIAASILVTVAAGAVLNVTALGAGRLDLASGQTLRGEGIVTGSVTARSGSSVEPGSSPGILTVNGNLALQSGSVFRAEIGGPSPGSGAGFHDRLDVNGTVALGDSTLDVSLVHEFTPSSSALQSFVIIDNDGTDNVNGTFAGLPEGSPVQVGDSTLYITYSGGDGNDVVLNSQPVVNGTNGWNDTLVLRATASGTNLEFSLNGAAFVDLGPIAGLPSFTFNGLDGHDLMIVDAVNGLPLPSGGVFFHGGANTAQANLDPTPSGTVGDALQVVGAMVADQAYAYLPNGTTTGSGAVAVVQVSTMTPLGGIEFTGVDSLNATDAAVEIGNVAVVATVFPGLNDVLTLAGGWPGSTWTRRSSTQRCPTRARGTCGSARPMR
jgi:fibronectin-binding autotransporter adhesin